MFIVPLAFSQADSIAYSRDFEFKEGIYLTVNQFKSNSPILRKSVVSAVGKNELDFFFQVTELNEITYRDIAGTEQQIKTTDVWGFCQNRSVYINLNNHFNKLIVIGSLGHFTAPVKTSVAYHDPMNGYSNTVEELRQFTLDLKNNKVYEFNSKNMEMLLKSDNDLYTQFMGLKKRDKANSIFIYLRKYNEKYPFYLPPN